MSKPIRMGVVGAGAIAQRGILPHLSQDDVQEKVVLGAICDPVEGRAQAAADKFGVPRAFTTYEELLEHGDVDAVSIASPIGLHYEQGKMALQAGKHIHFNKTMTTTVAEATELIEMAEQRDLKIVASPGEVLRPNLQHLKKIIAEGAIGDLCWGACGVSFGRYHETENEFRTGSDVLSNVDPTWYYRKPGGGPLYDMTVYPLHGLTTVLGPAKRVTAMSGVRLKEREFKGQMVPCEADDNTLMLLDFGNNVFVFAYGTPYGGLTPGFDTTYFGTKGTIQGMKLNGEPIAFPGHEVVSEGGWAGFQWILPHVKGAHRDIEEQHVFEDIMQLVDWARDGIASPVSAQHARHVIDIIESAYRSAETGQAQELSTTF